MTLTCLGRFSEGVHILQGSSVLVGDSCQPLGPMYSPRPAPSQGLSPDMGGLVGLPRAGAAHALSPSRPAPAPLRLLFPPSFCLL